MSGEPKISLLLVGISEAITQLVHQILGEVECRALTTAEDLAAFVEDPGSSRHQVAIAGAAMEGVSTVEIAQSIRAVLIDSPILFCHDSRGEGFDRGEFIKNGFSEAFLLPFETETFRAALKDIASRFLQARHFKPVKLIDIQPDVALDFDLFLFLPQNKKYIRYSAAGDPIDAERVGRFKDHQMSSAFVPAEQMSEFYRYSARVLKSLCETEKRERLQGAVRDLVTGIFTTAATGFDDGKKMMADAGKIVESFVAQTPVGDWYS
jgi:hypothetical protein